MAELTIGQKQIVAGTKEFVKIGVSTDLNGCEIYLPIHVVAGEESGPTLAVLAALHGSEWLSVEVIRRFVEELDPGSLAGNVITIPVGNPVAFNFLTRNTPDESDNADLNRVFPGTFTWFAELLAQTITREVLKRSDFLVDLHMGIWGSAMGTIAYGIDFPDREVIQASQDLARSFGYPLVQRGNIVSYFPGPKSAAGYVGAKLKLPNLLVEIGGAGFAPDVEEAWLKQNLIGLRNLLIHLGMTDGKLELPDSYLLWEKRWRVNPTIAGFLMPELSPADMGKEVSEGELLGRIVSPYSFDVLEELTAPGDGVIFYLARSYPVRPGDWAFGVVDLNDSGTNWVDADGWPE